MILANDLSPPPTVQPRPVEDDFPYTTWTTNLGMQITGHRAHFGVYWSVWATLFSGALGTPVHYTMSVKAEKKGQHFF